MADEQRHRTYMYLHLVPWRRHLLLLRDDMRVHLLSSRDSISSRTSVWHGEHTNLGDTIRGPLGSARWSMLVHYAGDDGHFLRRGPMRINIVFV